MSHFSAALAVHAITAGRPLLIQACHIESTTGGASSRPNPKKPPMGRGKMSLSFILSEELSQEYTRTHDKNLMLLAKSRRKPRARLECHGCAWLHAAQRGSLDG